MNLVINLTAPILLTGQQLKVEYSTDGVSYTLDSYQTTNSFTTTFGGFVAGTLYYFRFTLVKNTSPAIECDPVVKTYFIPEEIPCVEFSAELTARGDAWNLEITWVTPSPFNLPCGGYILKYGTSYPLQSIAYASLPPSPIIFPATNQTYYVELYSLDCEGNMVLCDEIEVPPTIAPCTPAVITSSLIQLNGFKISLSIVPGSPAAASYTISYHQANAVTSGVPDPGGTLNLISAGTNPELFTISVNPNLNLYGITVSYVGSITDGCGTTVVFDLSLQI